MEAGDDFAHLECIVRVSPSLTLLRSLTLASRSIQLYQHGFRLFSGDGKLSLIWMHSYMDGVANAASNENNSKHEWQQYDQSDK